MTTVGVLCAAANALLSLSSLFSASSSAICYRPKVSFFSLSTRSTWLMSWLALIIVAWWSVGIYLLELLSICCNFSLGGMVDGSKMEEFWSMRMLPLSTEFNYSSSIFRSVDLLFMRVSWLCPCLCFTIFLADCWICCYPVSSTSEPLNDLTLFSGVVISATFVTIMTWSVSILSPLTLLSSLSFRESHSCC